MCDVAKIKQGDTKNVFHPNFKGLMANSAQANWNVVHIVYGSSDPSESPINKGVYLSLSLDSIHGQTQKTTN
jgi:hypothetical protein